MIGNMPQEIDDFHSHLDKCEQCKENPIGLCGKGLTLLLRAGGAAEEWLRKNHPENGR